MTNPSTNHSDSVAEIASGNLNSTNVTPADEDISAGDILLPENSSTDNGSQRLQALRMHATLNQKYFGYKYTCKFPTSMEATVTPELFPSEMRARYEDEKLKLGKFDTFPTWFKKIGSSIRSQLSTALMKYSSNTDIRFGYMVPKERFMEVEAALLATRGVTEADESVYEGTDVVANARLLIQQRLDRRDDWELQNNAPVTYNSYIEYMYDRYDILRAEIISEYRRMFSEDLVNVIESYIPSRQSLRNPSRIRCDWKRTIEVPSLVMQGDATWRQIADSAQAEEELAHEKETIRRREIESWRQDTLDAVTDIQKGLRKMIAEKVVRLKNSLDKTLMTDEEIQERRDSGAKRVVDPAKITKNSVNQLTNIIDDLTGELGQFDSTDEFYQAITEFRRELNMEEVDLEDNDDRQRLSEDIDRIVGLSLEDNIDPTTGEFFVGIM